MGFGWSSATPVKRLFNPQRVADTQLRNAIREHPAVCLCTGTLEALGCQVLGGLEEMDRLGFGLLAWRTELSSMSWAGMFKVRQSQVSGRRGGRETDVLWSTPVTLAFQKLRQED